MKYSAFFLFLFCASQAYASDKEENSSRTRTIIITAPGNATDLGDALKLDRTDITLSGSPDMLAALTQNYAGVSLQDAQGNPWQPNLVYRGYVVSPLQGQAQGLAVYVDGMRFNQPFGDTVNFDLLPDAAIQSVSLRDADPVYGLNALGGALIIETATGLSAEGIEASAAIGSYGKRDISVSAGGATDRFSYFGAAMYREEEGWRDYSPSDLANGYLDFGYDGNRAGAHIKFIGADTDLTGNGVAPVELLAARRQSVFTWPDNTRNRYSRISLHPWFDLGQDVRVTATLYRQRRKAHTLNGDAADIEECEDDDLQGFLCLERVGEDDDNEEEEQSALTASNGDPVADLLNGGDYGVLNRGRIKTRSEGMLAQIESEHELFGRPNRFVAGFSFDTSETDFSTSTELGEMTEQRSVEGFGIIIDQDDNSIAPVELETRTRFWSTFFNNTFQLGETLTADIGLRYNYGMIRLIDRLGSALNGRHRFNRLNPGIRVKWAISPDISLRTGYSESNRVPTAAELSCADEDAPCSLTNFFIADPPLEQVVAKSFELGASGRHRRDGWAIDWLLSGYHTTNTNDIQYVASPIRGRAFFRNIGQTRRQGIEATVKAAHNGLGLAASYAFIDATYRTPITVSSPANPQADDDGLIEINRGNELPGIPRHSATFSANYSGTLGSQGYTIGGDMIVRSSQRLVGDEAGLNAAVPGYILFNVRGSVELIGGVSLIAELRNVFDRKYASFGTYSEVDEVYLAEAPGASNPRAYGPGAPRRGSVGLRFKF